MVNKNFIFDAIYSVKKLTYSCLWHLGREVISKLSGYENFWVKDCPSYLKVVIFSEEKAGISLPLMEDAERMLEFDCTFCVNWEWGDSLFFFSEINSEISGVLCANWEGGSWCFVCDCFWLLDWWLWGVFCYCDLMEYSVLKCWLLLFWLYSWLCFLKLNRGALLLILCLFSVRVEAGPGYWLECSEEKVEFLLKGSEKEE